MLIILPFYLFLRYHFGELITHEIVEEVEFMGLNKDEKLKVRKEAVLIVKASENYVDIYYAEDNSVRHITFRNTLTAISQHAPFLNRSHRSYLVNIANIKTVTGNSQNARIVFHSNDLEIPLSKSYYKNIKSTLIV